MVATALGGWFAGSRGMTSAFLGGMISLVAGFAFAAMASRKTAKSPTQALLAALKAEAVKIGLAVLLLLVVLVTYKEVAVAWLVVSFVATLLSFSITAFVREA